MPAEAVEELADAIADANGGPIQLVANDSNTDGRRTSGGGTHRCFPAQFSYKAMVQRL